MLEYIYSIQNKDINIVNYMCAYTLPCSLHDLAEHIITNLLCVCAYKYIYIYIYYTKAYSVCAFICIRVVTHVYRDRGNIQTCLYMYGHAQHTRNTYMYTHIIYVSTRLFYFIATWVKACVHKCIKPHSHTCVEYLPCM